MQALMLLIQAMSQNVALCCCALFAGGACYVSLVEQPALQGNRNDLTAAYLLLAQPRPGIYAGFFALVGGLTGIAAGASAGSHWWLAGGVLLMVAAVLQLGVLGPQTRRLLASVVNGEMDGAQEPLERLARLHGAQSLLGLGALFLFISRT
jgi:hypothetical protein